jgi:drug/metabolite transporter (DMT)-like permease
VLKNWRSSFQDRCHKTDSDFIALLANTDASLVSWIAILVGGILGTGLAYVAQTIGQQTIDAWRVALIFATEPLFAALGGYWMMGEVLTTMAWLGAVLIILSMLVAELADGD